MIRAGWAQGGFQAGSWVGMHRYARLFAGLPFAILVVGLLLTLGLLVGIQNDITHELETEFRFRSGKIQARLLNRLETHANLLHGVQGLFRASKDISRVEFHDYVESLRLEPGFPGIQGIGFARRIAPEELDAHVAAVRREGFPTYQVWPAGARDPYSAIVYLEPFTGRNLRAFGYDMFSEPVRRAAMERAWQSGEAALSGRVTLMQETRTAVQAGFLIYVPVYAPTSGPEDAVGRRPPLLGWAYSPIRMNDFMLHLLASIEAVDLETELDLEVFDGDGLVAERLTFDADGQPSLDRSTEAKAGRSVSRFRAELPIDFGGHRWTLMIASQPAFDARLRESHLFVVGAAGMTVSVLMALLFGVMSASHRRVARALAETARVNRELADREETFRILFETVPQGVAYHDAQGRFLMANPAARTILGRSLEELRQLDFGDPIWGVVREDGTPYPAAELPAARALTRREAVQDAVLGLVAHGGGPATWLRVTAIPIDQPGNPARLYTTFQDITARKRTDAELERYRHSLEELVTVRTEQLEQANRALQVQNAAVSDLYNHAPCGYHTLDAEGRIVSINDTELAWLGLDRAAVMEHLRFDDLLTEASRAAYRIHLPRFLETGGLHDLELDMLRQDGSVLPVVLSATLVRDETGRFQSARVTVFDNAERKARMAQIDALNIQLAHRAEEAEAASRAKSTLLANMSHEFRTPMNAILGLTHLLARATTDPAQLDKLNKVSAAGHRLLGLLNTVLDLANVETGRLKLHYARFNLGTMLELCLEHAQASVGGKPLTLAGDIAPNLRQVVEGDPERLGEVVDKLLDNAVKFTAAGGVILRARCQDQSETELVVRIEVADTGIGISPEDQARLFQPFSQLDDSSTRQFGGSGLGLAVSKRLMELMGGSIGVTSRPGEGSTFWITLRLAKV